MFSLSFFETALELSSGWKVTDITVDDSAKEVTIEVVFTGKKGLLPGSDKLCPIYDHAPLRRWRHLDLLQYKTFISCRLPRVYDADGKVVTVDVPWADKHNRFSFLFERLAINLLLATKNQSKTAKLLRCGYNVVNRILHSATERGLMRRELSQSSIERLSVDEKSFKKNHHYVTVLSCPSTGCILDVSKGRTKKATKKLLTETLTEEQLGSVQEISMDMWLAFRVVAEETLPNADITHDRFHLVKYLNSAIDKVRRREVKSNEGLKKSRFLFLKKEENLSQKQRIAFEIIKKANYEASKAWVVRENFKGLFNSEKATCSRLFNNWAKEAIDLNIKEITKVVVMFQNHLSGVINALTSRLSNAMAERLNGKIQEIKTSAKGYRTFNNFRSAILFFHGGLDLYPRKTW